MHFPTSRVSLPTHKTNNITPGCRHIDRHALLKIRPIIPFRIIHKRLINKLQTHHESTTHKIFNIHDLPDAFHVAEEALKWPPLKFGASFQTFQPSPLSLRSTLMVTPPWCLPRQSVVVMPAGDTTYRSDTCPIDLFAF